MTGTSSELDYRQIMSVVESWLIGQPRAVAQLERSLKIAQVGLRDPSKPLAVLMFAGPTGVGKSEAARALAMGIHGSPDALCRVDCNLLKQPFSAASLTGSPPGYVGSQEGSTLLIKKIIEGYKGKPGIIVFEEVEKADPAVWEVLLGIFDKAVLRLNNGRGMISFANTIIILTSNVGARDLGAATSQGQIGFAPTAQPAAGRLQLPGERRRRIVLDEMQRVFSPEFINRLDDVVVFRWLDRPELELIARRFIDELNQRLGNRGHRLVVSSAAIRLLVEKGFDLKSGARQLSRAIRKYVEDPLAEAIVDGTPFEACTIYLQCAVGGQELAPFRYKKRFLPPAPPPSETEPSPLPRRLRPRPPMPPGTELVPIPPDSSE